MIIEAKFKGLNGSEGYESGKDYILAFNIQANPALPYYSHIIIYNNTGSGFCPYSSLKKFLDNWDVI